MTRIEPNRGLIDYLFQIDRNATFGRTDGVQYTLMVLIIAFHCSYYEGLHWPVVFPGNAMLIDELNPRIYVIDF